MNTLVGAILLTKTGGILGPIASILGLIMDLLFRFTSAFGIENIGLCIILFTLVTKILMIPLTVNQQKSSKLMSVMQPEIAAIQKKYKGKDDQKSMMMMNAETKAVYEKYGTSMTGGCLPLLIQMPIILALYRIIYNIPAYVESVKGYYMAVVNQLPAGFQNNEVFLSLVEAHKMTGDKYDFTQSNTVIDLLYKLTEQQWATLSSTFSGIGQAVTESGDRVVDVIERMQTVFGLNISSTPFQVISDFFRGANGVTVTVMLIALLIPLLAGLSQWYSVKIMSANQPQNTDDNPAANMMKSMNVTMPLMSVVFCFSLSAGVGFYWVAQSVFTILLQLGINAHLNKIEIDDLVQKNLEKTNRKRAKKGLPPVKVGDVDEMLKKIEAMEVKEEKSRMEKIAKTKVQVEESNQYYNENAKPGSLAAKASMVAKYNAKHEGGKK